MAMREERAGKRQRGNDEGGPGGEEAAELHSPTVQVPLPSLPSRPATAPAQPVSLLQLLLPWIPSPAPVMPCAC